MPTLGSVHALSGASTTCSTPPAQLCGTKQLAPLSLSPAPLPPSGLVTLVQTDFVCVCCGGKAFDDDDVLSRL